MNVATNQAAEPLFGGLELFQPPLEENIPAPTRTVSGSTPVVTSGVPLAKLETDELAPSTGSQLAALLPSADGPKLGEWFVTQASASIPAFSTHRSSLALQTF